MKYLKFTFIIAMIIVFMNIHLSQGGIGGSETQEAMKASLAQSELKEAVRGSIEDQSWMKAKSREEVYKALGRHFDGYLLNDLTDSSWKFIEQPTDLYCRPRLIDLEVFYNDGNMASAKALICIDDLETGHNEFGTGIFGLIKKDEGWRINYTAFSWEKPNGQR